MPAATPTSSVRHTNVIALLFAIALPIGWWATLTLMGKGPIADERDHHTYVELITHGRWQDDSPISVLPVFHLLAAGATYLPGASLSAVRMFNVAVAIGFVLLAATFSARMGNSTWGLIAILAVINPFILPYCSLVYTDILALALLMAVVVLHSRGARRSAMAVLFLAFLVRQTSLLWLPYFVACDLLLDRKWSSWRELFRREMLDELSPYVVCFLCMVISTAASQTLILNKHLSNTPRLSFAQFHSFLFAVAVLWLPLWIEHGVIAARGWFGRVAMHGRCWAVLAAASGVASMLFDNSHLWNGDLRYWRNQYLILMTWSELTRLLSSAFILLAAVGMVELIRRSPIRTHVLIFAASCAGYLSVHWLIDPRYYAFPLVMITILASLTTRQSLLLIAWQGVISITGCVYIHIVGDLYGGIW